MSFRGEWVHVFMYSWWGYCYRSGRIVTQTEEEHERNTRWPRPLRFSPTSGILKRKNLQWMSSCNIKLLASLFNINPQYTKSRCNVLIWFILAATTMASCLTNDPCALFWREKSLALLQARKSCPVSWMKAQTPGLCGRWMYLYPHIFTLHIWKIFEIFLIPSGKKRQNCRHNNFVFISHYAIHHHIFYNIWILWLILFIYLFRSLETKCTYITGNSDYNVQKGVGWSHCLLCLPF